MSDEIKTWLNGLSEHMALICEKYASQAAYGQAINVESNYMSLVLNRRYGELSRDMVVKIAEKANYDKLNLHHIGNLLDKMNNTQWRGIKKETAVEFENSRRRERMKYSDTAFISQSDVIENQKANPPAPVSAPQDIFLITRYAEMRNNIPYPHANLPAIRKALLHCLCEDLIKLNEKDLC